MKPTTVLTLFLPILLAACSPSSSPRKTPAQEAADKRHQKAVELFSERCKTAGEKIHRTVDNVEGVFLMKLRPEKDNFSDQFALTDPYGRSYDGIGEPYGNHGYIGSFLWARNAQGHLVEQESGARSGYHYVELTDPQDGTRYRYTGGMKAWAKMDVNAPNVQLELKANPNMDLNVYRFTLEKTLSAGPQLRYGVTYDDISTREEREYWIAGSSLKVINLKTNEVIAERIGYMMDPGQGSLGRGSGRSPWLIAAKHACPQLLDQSSQTRDFVEKVLHIKQGK